MSQHTATKKPFLSTLSGALEAEVTAVACPRALLKRQTYRALHSPTVRNRRCNAVKEQDCRINELVATSRICRLDHFLAYPMLSYRDAPASESRDPVRILAAPKGSREATEKGTQISTSQ